MTDWQHRERKMPPQPDPFAGFGLDYQPQDFFTGFTFAGLSSAQFLSMSTQSQEAFIKHWEEAKAEYIDHAARASGFYPPDRAHDNPTDEAGNPLPFTWPEEPK